MDLIRFSERAGYEIAGIWKETASGSKDKRQKRQQILALAQSRKIDIILVTELTRWGRSTLELFHSLNDLNSWGVSLIAQTGLQFDLSTPQGKLIATLIAYTADHEHPYCSIVNTSLVHALGFVILPLSVHDQSNLTVFFA